MAVWYSVVVLLLFTSHLFSNEIVHHQLFDWSLSGYIKGEFFTDSRQTTGDEEDEVSYFPKAQIDDPAGHDINARGSTRMDAFESRVCGNLSEIKVGDVKFSGMVEIDFEIFYMPVTNVPHMRHAYGKLDWKNCSFLFGQTWHPVVFIEPKTVNYNGSTPFDFYARSPQFAFTYHTPRNMDIIFTVASEADFDTDGPYGFTNNYIRWGIIPNLNIKCTWFVKDHVMAISGDYKRIAPRIESNNGYKVHERLSYCAAIWYVGLKWPSVEINAKVNWGQNATDYSAVGGYAVKQGSVNPITDERSYTNINTVGLWFDIEVVKNKKIKPGLYIGFLQNLGSFNKIELKKIDENPPYTQNTIFGFANDVHNVFRISSRLTSEIYNITFAGEVEYTTAAYGTINQYARVVNTRPAELIRCTFGAYYFF